MKVERDAILTCSACGVEGPHELLYLSEHLSASRCVNCGKSQIYSGRIYSEYARDLVERTGRLPRKFVEEALKHPTKVVGWPLKALLKPYGLIREVDQVNTFHQSNRSPTPGRRI